MDLSVVVSTWNRAADVRRFLESLRHTQVNPGRSWEVVMVDNRSTDETAQLVQGAIQSANYKLKYVFEGVPGKSRGVNAGIRASEGRIIALTDDDAIVPEDWVEKMIRHFETHAEASCIGGMVKPYSPGIANVSIRLSTVPAEVREGNFSATSIPIIGCNMAFRRSVLDQTGLFDPDLGPGTPVKAAEDLDILYRVIRAGHALNYVPEISLFHNHDRRTPEQIKPVNDGYLAGRGAFYFKFLLKRDMQVARWFYWELRSQLRRMFQDRSPGNGIFAGPRAMCLIVAGGFRYLWSRTLRPASG